MRSYKTVGDILKQISAWQQDLLDRCCEGETPDPDDPFYPLVEYLIGHEKSVQQVLKNFEPTERDAVLNTWLQYVPAEQVDAVFSKRNLSDRMTSEDVIEMILEFDDGLVELYKTLANQAQAPPRINILFQSLLQMGEWQKFRNAWATRESDSHITGRG